MHDMDIRGTGNMLGPQQHGHIKTIGFDLYCQLLEETVKELQGETIEEVLEPNLNIPVNAFIPKNYIDDINQRLLMYRKISGIKTPDDITEISAEVVDRFGPIPESANNLLRIMDLKRLCRSVKIENLDVQKDNLVIVFHSDARFQQDLLARYIARKTPRIRPASAKKMYYRIGNVKETLLLDRITEILIDFENMKPAQSDSRN